MNQTMIAALFNMLLTTVGGSVLASGAITSDQIAIISGALATIVGIGISVYRNTHSSIIASAASLSSVASVTLSGGAPVTANTSKSAISAIVNAPPLP